MIIVFLILGFAFNFLQTEYGITFYEAPEFTRQLCTFWLKISKVKRKGGVWDLDFPTIKAPSALGLGLFSSTVVLSLFSTFQVFATLNALIVLISCVLFPFDVTLKLPTSTSWGPWMFCNTSHSFSLSCVIFYSSNTVMFSLIFFKYSTTL